ncbi:sensor domain-containing phosphodiesterase [Pseudomonas sp. GOM7]|uniref:bifunctional diguanylate cyclase/phosphodiesterase n=1 Tax=Pseudomonas sp. GOM7 TaxID=2998079 RepID=UPI00227BF049|nr:sensor domain-containing phosphodiesterase [Pseudomonas sp. GOM7]WAJ37611.1 sensor domain-containing phosphodiesterase [Pseudomonas sp. GOM7]
MRIPLPTPSNEPERQALIDDLRCFEGIEDPVFEHITSLGAHYFNLPIALISIIDENRQWFWSRKGLEVCQTPRDDAFCAFAILEGELFEICDATLDSCFQDNPLVTGEPGIRYYAGCPLITQNGLALGSFCVIDTQPRPPMSMAARDMLRQLAAMVMARIEELHRSNYIDTPSGLFNRERFEQDVRNHQQRQSSTLVVAADVIAPSLLNRIVKALGYPFSNQLMEGIKERLDALHGSPLYKLSQTRFGLILPGATDIERLAASVARQFERPIDCRGIPIQISPGLGVRHLRADDRNEDWLRLLISSADHARENGKRWSLYEPLQDAAQQRALLLLTSLSMATGHGQLHLEYQPKAELAGGQVTGVEALLRWVHPTLGPISPAEFIPLAEKTALMGPLSLWVARHTIEQTAIWWQQGLTWRVSFNVCAADLEDVEFVDQLIALLQTSDLPAEAIELEFTESALMTRPEDARRNLLRLRELGIGLAIDDFGTGYSNWTYLRELPATCLKLDRSLTFDLLCDERAQWVVQSITQLAKKLGYRVVAEGVETAQMQDLLQHLGCDEIQGFHLARPMRPEALADWLRLRQRLPVHAT